MAEKPRLLFLAGSIRPNSYNQNLARSAGVFAQERGNSVQFIDLADYPLPLYSSMIEEQSGPPEAAQKLAALMLQHQGIFIASPEYNASVTPLLKNTLDWVSRVKNDNGTRLELFKSRIFAIGSASPSGLGGMRSLIALRQILSLGLGAIVLAEQVTISHANKAFSEDGTLQDERSRSMLERLIVKLERATRLFEDEADH